MAKQRPRRKVPADEVFAALGDSTRLGLVRHLARAGPTSISRLRERTQVTRQAVTKHLHVLEEAGLARGERVGREHVWHLESPPFDEARAVLDQIEAHWGDALDRLRAFVEEDDEDPA